MKAANMSPVMTCDCGNTGYEDCFEVYGLCPECVAEAIEEFWQQTYQGLLDSLEMAASIGWTVELSYMRQLEKMADLFEDFGYKVWDRA